MAKDDASKRIVQIGKAQAKYFRQRAGLLQSGKMRTQSVVGGKIIDTTEDELALSLKQAAEFDALATKHGGS